MRAICSGSIEDKRVGGPLEERVRHLTPELLDQFLELLAGLGRDEVVVLQGLDPPAGVTRLEVQRHAPLRGDVVGDVGPPLVPRGRRFLHQLVDGRPLVRLDLVEPRRDLRHVTVGIALRPATPPGGGAAAR